MKLKGLFGLANINIELTSRCNKDCWMCGRRRSERDYPELVLKYGDMDFKLVKKIARGEGFGGLLGKGCRKASEIIGKDSDYYCTHLKGQDNLDAVRNRGCINACNSRITR